MAQPKELWSDRARALTESVIVFGFILALVLPFVTPPLWILVVLWFITCLLWPAKPIMWKRPSN